jgi:hypothetical protein
LRCGQTNGDYNTFQILQYSVIGEPKHAVSARRKPFIAATVMTKTRFKVVAFPVEFNDKLAGMRHKVRDVMSHRGLSAKPESG